MTEFISQNLMLVALFVISGAMFIWPTIGKLFSGDREISTLEATRLLNTGNALILDIRDNSAFAAGHIPKSRNIPMPDIAKRVDEIGKFKEKPVVLACQNGGRSNAVTRQLKQLGFVDIYQLQGGYNAWQQAGLPIEK
ncbi:MAG: rhodanese-like domain-containing protein [Betaproteobacteria bacterium]|nr:rhodanese-like domain-containing protein [Betaproteobacteria bacterium]